MNNIQRLEDKMKRANNTIRGLKALLKNPNIVLSSRQQTNIMLDIQTLYTVLKKARKDLTAAKHGKNPGGVAV